MPMLGMILPGLRGARRVESRDALSVHDARCLRGLPPLRLRRVAFWMARVVQQASVVSVMALRFRTEADLQAALSGKPKRSKYGATRVEWQGQKFDSRHELADWKCFEQQRLDGHIRAVIRQVSLPLSGSTRRIRVDFMIVERDGKIRFYDSKGYDTPTGRLKRQQIFEAYGIEVRLL